MDSHIPSEPYILTIPQDVEPRFHFRDHQQASQWRAHTPFQKDDRMEEQYSTWHFHEPGGMYVQQITQRDQPSSRVSTPKPAASNGPKKTMSLDAYKKKVAGGTPGPDEKKKTEVNGVKDNAQEKKDGGDKSAKKPAVKGPVERIKADEEVLAAVEDGDDVVPPVPEKKRDDGKKDLKRKREAEKNEDVKDVKRKREDSKMSDESQEKRQNDAKPKKEITKQEAVQQSAKPTEPSPKKADISAKRKSDDEQPAAKKAKVAKVDDNSAAKADDKASRKKSQSEKQTKAPEKLASSPPRAKADAADIALPPRLSPLREDNKEDADDDMSLPPRLSPTLPANITATLAAREHQRSTSKSSGTGDNLSPPRKALENGIVKRKSPVNGFRTNSNSPMVRPDAEDARGGSKPSAQMVRSPSASCSEIAVGKAAAVSKKESKEKLVVKLKFKQRSAKESLRQLLRLPAAKKKPAPDSKPSPKPSPTTLKAADARHREQRDANAKGVAQRVGPATKGVARKVEKSATSTPAPSEKRVREDDSEAEKPAAKRKKADLAVYEPPAKRKKSVPEALDLKTSPVTPSQPNKQPPTPASSVKKPASQPAPSATVPKKSGNELLAAATTSAHLKRESSNDGQASVVTPSAASSSPAPSSVAPGPASAAPKSTPTTASTSAPTSAQTKSARQVQWDTIFATFNTLGRDLKRTAAADLKKATESKPSPTNNPELLRRLAAAKALESLLAYLLAFTCFDESLQAAEPKQALRTTPWRTLLDYFPFVKHHTEPYSALQGLANALAVSFCSRIIETCVGEKSGREEILTQAWMMLSRSAAEAESKLDIKILMDRFSKSWAARESTAAAEEKLEPGKFSGSYRLPLGVQSKPVKAVRAAHAMLKEWMEGEGVGYEMKVKLDQQV